MSEAAATGVPARADAPFWTSRSEADTEDAGARLAAALAPGDLVVLRGPLGAGKTRFVAGLARGLGFAGQVKSPTFTLIHEYAAGATTLFHADLYRLDGTDVPALGLDELLERGILVVEWGEKLPAALARDALTIDLAIQPGDTRTLAAAAIPGTRGDALRAALVAVLSPRGGAA